MIELLPAVQQLLKSGCWAAGARRHLGARSKQLCVYIQQSERLIMPACQSVFVVAALPSVSIASSMLSDISVAMKLVWSALQT